MTWYNERFYILRDSMYWGQNLSFFQFSNFVLNIWSLIVSHCIKSSQFIERFNVSSLLLYQVISMYQKISTCHPLCRSYKSNDLFLAVVQLFGLRNINILAYFIVSKYSVVDHHEFVGVVWSLRVRIDLWRFSVRGPTCVRNGRMRIKTKTG